MIKQDKLEEYLVPRIELDAGRKPHIVRYTMTKKLKNIIQHRSSMFERVYPVKEKVALKMLKTGYKQPSRFGRWCPVRVSHLIMYLLCLIFCFLGVHVLNSDTLCAKFVINGYTVVPLFKDTL